MRKSVFAVCAFAFLSCGALAVLAGDDARVVGYSHAGQGVVGSTDIGAGVYGFTSAAPRGLGELDTIFAGEGAAGLLGVGHGHAPGLAAVGILYGAIVEQVSQNAGAGLIIRPVPRAPTWSAPPGSFVVSGPDPAGRYRLHFNTGPRWVVIAE